jgi:hypothetical protein
MDRPDEGAPMKAKARQWVRKFGSRADLETVINATIHQNPDYRYVKTEALQVQKIGGTDTLFLVTMELRDEPQKA